VAINAMLVVAGGASRVALPSGAEKLVAWQRPLPPACTAV